MVKFCSVFGLFIKAMVTPWYHGNGETSMKEDRLRIFMRNNRITSRPADSPTHFQWEIVTRCDVWRNGICPLVLNQPVIMTLAGFGTWWLQGCSEYAWNVPWHGPFHRLTDPLSHSDRMQFLSCEKPCGTSRANWWFATVCIGMGLVL